MLSRAGPATAHRVVTLCSKAWAGWALIPTAVALSWRHVVKPCVTLVNGLPTVSSFPIRNHCPQILGGYIDGQEPPKAGADLFQNLGCGLQTSSERFWCKATDGTGLLHIISGNLYFFLFLRNPVARSLIILSIIRETNGFVTSTQKLRLILKTNCIKVNEIIMII